MRKALLGAVVVLVAAIGLNGAAGAAPQISAAPARLATQAAAAQYLRSLGIDPAGVVVQRGSKNYAGPNCPGSGWNCTDATRVLQISARGSSTSANTFSCTPSSAGTSSPNKCVIVQTSTTGNNTAACKLSGTTSGVTQECNVTQTSDSGTNRLDLKEELTLTGATTSGTQLAAVDQNNGSGANIVGLTQRSTESMSLTAASIGMWSQSASQSFTIDQDASTGANSVDISQAVAQTQTALNATSGSQSQSSTQEASIDQSSAGAATVKIKQSESQTQRAKATGGVTQTQVGPQRCCSTQTGNPATATVKQESTQIQTPGSGSSEQVQSQTVTYSSTGNVSGSQTSTQDGTTSTNTFSGSTVSEQQACSDGSCTTEPPPPPANWTPFTWFGGDGTVVNGSPFAVTAGAPVVLSVTDIACKGDQFAISDGAAPLGTTSAVPEAPSCSAPNPGDTNDPAVAFADPTYSHGTFALAAGSHSIGITASNSPFGQGGAYYSVDPMTTAHCTGGRWATFTSPTFSSETDCLAFVGA
jgi:hypothetical protein